MTTTPPPPGRDTRPAPTVFHAGMIVPSELTAELAAALAEYLTLLPAARRAGRLSKPVAAILMASKECAAEWQRHQHAQRASAAPTATSTTVLGTAQLPAVSTVEEITTAQAADLAGYSPEWWRRLAVRGTVPARQIDRRTWLLNRSGVIAYANRSTQEDHRGRHDHPPQPRPERQAG